MIYVAKYWFLYFLSGLSGEFGFTVHNFLEMGCSMIMIKFDPFWSWSNYPNQMFVTFYLIKDHEIYYHKKKSQKPNKLNVVFQKFISLSMHLF